MSNYVTRFDLKNTAGGNTSKFAKKTDLASLKSELIDKLDIDKLAELDVDKLKVVHVNSNI